MNKHSLVQNSLVFTAHVLSTVALVDISTTTGLRVVIAFSVT